MNWDESGVISVCMLINVSLCISGHVLCINMCLDAYLYVTICRCGKCQNICPWVCVFVSLLYALVCVCVSIFVSLRQIPRSGYLLPRGKHMFMKNCQLIPQMITILCSH